MKNFAFTALAIAALAGTAAADVIWTFNSLPSDTNSATGTLVPEVGTGTAGLFGGTTGTFASGNASGGSTDPETSNNDSGWNLTTWAAQGTDSGLRGAQFSTSTVGLFQNLFVSFDARHSNTMSRTLQVSFDNGDGQGFRTTGLSNNGIFDADQGGDRWYNNRLLNLPAAAANVANLTVRIAAVFVPGTTAYAAATSGSTYGTAGTLRLDMVRINGEIPSPGSAALAVAGGLLIARRRRVK
jgi:hypothetical protein